MVKCRWIELVTTDICDCDLCVNGLSNPNEQSVFLCIGDKRFMLRSEDCCTQTEDLEDFARELARFMNCRLDEVMSSKHSL
jgi:hypothetical protein